MIRSTIPIRLLAAAVLAAFAGSALGQAKGVGGSFDEPLGGQPAPQGQGTAVRSAVKIISTEDGQTVEVSIEDDKVSAKVNGKEVPRDRIRRGDDRIEILDDDGDVIKTFQVGRGGRFWIGEGGAPFAVPRFGPGRMRLFLEPGGVPGWPDLEPPKVMIGINMSDVSDEDEAKDLGVEPGQAIRVERVIEGLAAEQAGLKQGDVIVEVDGKRPATSERLRAVLKDKEAGDTVTLRVLRDGKEKTVKVQLQAYDPEKLGVTMFGLPGPDEGAAKAWGEAAQRALKEAERAFREALRLRADMDGVIVGRGPGQWELFAAPDGQERVNKRLADLNERIERLDQRLEELDRRLARLADSIEKMVEQRRPD